jgi:sec-independent protein translocase protein TatA
MGLDNPLHILILLVVVLLVFGAKRLPEIGRSLGEGMRGLKGSLQGSEAHASVDQMAVAPQFQVPAMPVPAPERTAPPTA